MVVGRFHWTVAPSPRRNPHKHSDLATHSPNGSKRPALARGGVTPERRDSSRGQGCHRSGPDESQELYAAGPGCPDASATSLQLALPSAGHRGRREPDCSSALPCPRAQGPAGRRVRDFAAPSGPPRGAIPGRAPAKGGGGRSVRQPSHWPLPMTATITGTVTDIAHARRLSRILGCSLTSSD